MTRQLGKLLLASLIVLLAIVPPTGGAAVVAPPANPGDIEPDVAAALSRYLEFSPAELADLQNGKVIKHGVESSGPGEIAVAGAVRVEVPPARLLAGVRDIADFKRSPDVLEIGRFSDPPAPHDLDGLTVDKQDFDPRDCHVGACGIRLPAESIRRLPLEVNVTAPDAQERAGRWLKQTLLAHVNAYWSGAPGRMTSYDDGSRPIRPANDSAALLSNAPAIGALFPSLAEHLATFPSERSDGFEDFLYWSKEKFGMEPFISVTHVTMACRTERSCMVASKDVYSSRYIDASLSLTIASGDLHDQQALYLVYANRSRANALKGSFATMRRAIAERRARGGLEETLRSLKRRLESGR